MPSAYHHIWLAMCLHQSFIYDVHNIIVRVEWGILWLCACERVNPSDLDTFDRFKSVALDKR